MTSGSTRWVHRIWRKRFGATIVFAFVLSLVPLTAQRNSTEHWVGTWATAEVGRPQNPPPPPSAPQAAPAGQPSRPPAVPQAFMHFTNQTLRQIVHTSIGGSMVRMVLSNAFGAAPLTIGAAQIAVRDKESAIVAASARPLTFSGQPAIAIPAGAAVVSDAVSLTV